MTSNDTASRPGPVNWLLELDSAIAKGDEARMWEAVYHHPDQVEVQQKLADTVPRLCYSVARRKNRFSEMFLSPVVVTGDRELFTDQQVWKAANLCIEDALRSWFQSTDRLSMFSGMRPYDWIGTWRPSTIRGHLLSVVPGSSSRKTEFLAEWIDLPPEAPRLGFISMVATAETGWPKLPGGSGLRDSRYAAVVSGILCRENVPPPVVRPPEHVQFAIVDGLAIWLQQLHERVPIVGWMAAPDPQSMDVVRVSLKLDHKEVPHTQFTLRRHQLGPNGVHEVLVVLESIAPMMDTPLDVPQRMPQRVVLDLT